MPKNKNNNRQIGEMKLSIDPVNDKSIKRLLKQKTVTGAQIGRLLFLNICEMTENKEQLYTAEEYIELIKKLNSKDEKEVNSFLFYLRLSTYAVNEINELMVRDSLSLKGLKYIYSQFTLYKLTKNDEILNTEEIQNTIFDIRLNLKYINSYALFFDAVRKMLRDSRIKSQYRIIKSSREVLEQAKKYDDYILRNFTEKERKDNHLNFIGEIPRIYTEHSASKKTINEIIAYLKSILYPPVGTMDNVTTASIALYLNKRFPRD